jgi:hypothetical protein
MPFVYVWVSMKSKGELWRVWGMLRINRATSSRWQIITLPMGDGKKCHHGSSQARCGNLTHVIFFIFKVYLASCLAQCVWCFGGHFFGGWVA